MFNLILRTLLGVCCGLLIANTAVAQTAVLRPKFVQPVSDIHTLFASSIKRAFSCSSNRCVVRFNRGGRIAYFLLAGIAIGENAKKKLIIDGPCYSACTLAADLARPNACVTSRAKFYFHQAWSPSKDQPGRREHSDVSYFYSLDMQEWIELQGGLPKQGFLTMSTGAASEFWPPCPFKPPLPRPDPRIKSIEVVQTFDQWILDSRPLATRPPPKEDGVLSAKSK